MTSITGINQDENNSSDLLMRLSKVLYRQNMDYFTSKPTFIDSEDLEEQHEIYFQSTLEILSKTTVLTEKLIQDISQTLRSLYVYYEEINMKKKETSGSAIGIDFGTTFCCVSVVQNEEPKIIFNNLNQNQTPSYISFPIHSNFNLNHDGKDSSEDFNDDDDGDSEPVVGYTAKSLAHTNPQFTIFDVKRMIGRDFNDPRIQRELQLWPFGVVEENRRIKIQVGPSTNTTLAPEEVASILIKYLRAIAESYLQTSVLNAVVAVPAYFNSRQRELTKEACTMAGLNVLQLISEPTAAAVAYNFLKNQNQENPGQDSNSSSKNCLIFDLGGGTFDVAVLTMKNNHIHVKALGGDAHLGGEDFDNNMVNYCLQEFEKEHGIDLTKDKTSPDPIKRFKTSSRLRRLKMKCEDHKRNLTQAKQSTVSLEAIHGEIDLLVKFTRNIFESINMTLFEECMKIVEQVLETSKMKKEDIHDVVLVGGSSRIPKVQQMLSELFGGKYLCKQIDPDEAVAMGAAIIAFKSENPEISNVVLQEPYQTFKEPSLAMAHRPLVQKGMERQAHIAAQVKELELIFAKRQGSCQTSVERNDLHLNEPSVPKDVPRKLPAMRSASSDGQGQGQGHLMLKKVAGGMGEPTRIFGQWLKHHVELSGSSLNCSDTYDNKFCIDLKGARCNRNVRGTLLKNVFGLNLSNGSKYFLQANNEEELNMWISNIEKFSEVTKKEEPTQPVGEVQYRPLTKPKPPPKPTRIPPTSPNDNGYMRRKTRWFYGN